MLSSTIRISGAPAMSDSLAEKMDEMADEPFVRAFERGEVPPSAFDHRSHLRVAWVYLREAASRDEALARIRTQIQRFAAAAGKSQKYHETITIAWMILRDEGGGRGPAGGGARARAGGGRTGGGDPGRSRARRQGPAVEVLFA